MSEADRVAFAGDSVLVKARLERAARAVERLIASGVAWPDAGAAAALDASADGLLTLGLAGGAQRLADLAGAVEAVAGADDRSSRDAASRVAADALHAALVWLRVARSELDLEAVRAALRDEVTTDTSALQRPAVTTRVAPVGLERVGRRVVVHGLDDHGPILLSDQWLDIDPVTPLDRPVISRLFGDRIVPRAMLAGRVVAQDHPVSREGVHRVLRPSFVSRLRLDSTPASPKPVPTAVGSEDRRSFPPATSLEVSLESRPGEGAALVTAAGPIPLESSALRELALACLEVRGDIEGLRAVIRRRASTSSLLALDHPSVGRTFPDLDPGAFALSATTLFARVPLDSIAGLWLGAALVGHGADGWEALALASESLQPRTPLEHWWLARARAELDLPGRADGDAIRAALDDVDAEGQWPLLDVARQADLDAAVMPERRAAWRTHGASDLQAPSVGRVCARAMQLSDLGEEAHGATPRERAAAFLEAHVERRRGSEVDPELWPTPREWLWLSRAHGAVGGVARVSALRPDRLRLLRTIAAPVLRWARHGDVRDLGLAGDALWCALSADLDRLVVR